MLLADAVTWFLAELRDAGRTRPTRRAYRSVLRHLCRYAEARGVLHVEALTPELLCTAAAALREPGDRPHGWQGGWASARLLLAAAHGLSTTARADGIGMPDLTRGEVSA